MTCCFVTAPVEDELVGDGLVTEEVAGVGVVDSAPVLAVGGALAVVFLPSITPDVRSIVDTSVSIIFPVYFGLMILSREAHAYGLDPTRVIYRPDTGSSSNDPFKASLSLASYS